MEISLQPIDEENVRGVYELNLKPGQEQFVALNSWSLAQALAEYDIAWPRAIVADDEIVGFLMLEIDTEADDGRPFWLWRFMVDADHQGKGIGRVALSIALEEVRRRGGSELYTSWVPGDGSPEGFYLKVGFTPTGEVDEGEIVAMLDLGPS